MNFIVSFIQVLQKGAKESPTKPKGRPKKDSLDDDTCSEIDVDDVTCDDATYQDTDDVIRNCRHVTGGDNCGDDYISSDDVGLVCDDYIDEVDEAGTAESMAVKAGRIECSQLGIPPDSNLGVSDDSKRDLRPQDSTRGECAVHTQCH